MRTQFFYTEKVVVANGSPTRPNEEPIYAYRRNSFNLTAVIRSLEMPDGTVLVLLNDIHERTTETPLISVKTNKVTGTNRKRDTFQSEIYLSKEEGERFYQQSAIDYIVEPVLMESTVLAKPQPDSIH